MLGCSPTKERMEDCGAKLFKYVPIFHYVMLFNCTPSRVHCKEGE